MTEERLNPLTWLQSKFASLNHTHTKTQITDLETKVTNWSTTVSDNNIPSEKLTKDTLDTKISKSQTTGLVKNDGTIDTTTYSTFSGSYTDLSNKPSIPASSTDLSDGSSLVKTSNTSGLIKNDGSVDTNSYLTSSSLSGYQTTNNLVTSFSSTTSDSKYPSEKLTKTELDKKITKSNSATGLLKDDGTVMTSGTGSTNYAAGNHTHSGMLTSSDIADNLTTNDSSKVLSAKQGKALADLIGSAITYINQ